MLFRKIKNNSIRYKLMLAFSSSMIISVVLVLVIFIGINKKLTEEKLLKNDYGNLNLFYNFLLQEIDSVKLIANNIVTGDELVNRLEKNDSSNQYINEMNKLIYTYESIKSIYVIDENKNIDAFNDRAYFEIFPDTFLKSIKFDDLTSLKGKISYKIGKETYVSDDEGQQNIILSRAIISKNSFKPIGYLVIVINNDFIENIYRKCVEPSMAQYIISGKDGGALVIPSKSLISDLKDEVIKINPTNKYIRLKSDEGTYNVIVKESELFNGKIALLNSENDYYGGFGILFIMLIVVNIIFASIYFYWINLSVLKPLGTVSYWIEDLVNRNFLGKELNTEAHGDEINKINSALNEMSLKVNTLIEEVKNEHLQQRKLELNLLNNNVKPHFLFNILNVSRSLITLKEYESSKKLLNVTAQYYRGWLNKGNDIIQLSEEVNILKNYVDIMQIKNRNKDQVLYNIDEKILHLKVPKLILQPLVENSFKHGLKEDGSELVISITIAPINHNTIKISVMDNGKGLKKELIEQLYENCDIKAESGFGVKSIINRLSLYYSESNIRNIFTIDSKENEYTKVTLLLDEERLRKFT